MSWTNHCKRGSAFALVMAFIVAGTLAIWTSSTFVTRRYETLQASTHHHLATGALEAVLTRQEARILSLAEVGDPANFQRMHDNYGEEAFADCLVRWRIEPAHIRQVMRTKGDADGDGYDDHDTDGRLRYISNPISDITALAQDANQVDNDFIYIYRIAGEARYLPGGEPWDGDVLSRVQGARYVTITKHPVFRYVIFYAQEGPKGDLEFTHGPELTVNGSVQGNSSIYIGGDLRVNEWGSLDPPSNRSATLIGPDASGSPVRINGVNGIFRLDKKTLLSAVNDFPMSGTEPTGVISGGTLANDFYISDPSYQAVGEEGGQLQAYEPPPAGTAGDVYAATWEGTVVNPNRVTDGAGGTTLATVGAEVLINGTYDPATETYAHDGTGALYGVMTGGLAANDSRIDDWRRKAMRSWPEGHGGYARTRVNGGRVLRLPETLVDRAFEVQRLVYRDLDGDPTTDEHEYALPLFIDQNGAQTTDVPSHDGVASDPPIIEAPGRYVSYGLGSDLWFARMTENKYPVAYTDSRPANADHAFNGWYVTADPVNGTPISADPDGVYGLIIRERPQPDLSYFSAPAPIGEDHFYYMPFAYGKHNRRLVWPLWPIDVVATRTTRDGDKVVDAGIGYDFGSYLDRYSDWWHFDTRMADGAYSDGGRFRVTAAMDPGPDGYKRDYDDWTETGHWRDAGSDEEEEIGSAEQDGWYDEVSDRRRNPDYYRDNWRFFHMQRPERDAANGNGLTAKYFNNPLFNGYPVLQRIDANFGDYDENSPATDVNENWFSIRWQGFVTAEETGSHRFVGKADDGMRIWVDGKLVADGWETGGARYITGLRDGRLADVLLEKDRHYPIVIEYFEAEEGAHCELLWLRPSDDWSDVSNAVPVPSAALAPMIDTAFPTAEVESVQMKITGLTSAAIDPNTAFRQKAGLMIRGQGIAGLSSLNGGSTHDVDLVGDYVAPVSDQHKNGTMSYESSTLVLDGNTWQGFRIDYSFTQHTVLEFDYYSQAEPEIGGVALQSDLNDTSSGKNPKRRFILHGRQEDNSWFNDYKGVYSSADYGTWKRISIPVGNYYTGYVDYLVFINDEDADEPGRLSKFRNVQILEPDPATIAASNVTQVPHLLDGRDPYLAVLWSPDRGVFTQFRADRSRTVTNVQRTYFVCSDDGYPKLDDGDGDPTNDASAVNAVNGETGYSPSADPAPLPRTVYLDPHISTTTQTYDYPALSEKYGGDKPRRDDAERLETPLEYEMSVGVGFDGLPAMELHYFYGNEVRQVRQYVVKKYGRRTIERWRWSFQVDPGTGVPLRDNPAGQIFVDGSGDLTDYGRDITFFFHADEGSEASNVIWRERMGEPDGHWPWEIGADYVERIWHKDSEDVVWGSDFPDKITYSDGHTVTGGSGTTMYAGKLLWYKDDDIRDGMYDGRDSSRDKVKYYPFLRTYYKNSSGDIKHDDDRYEDVAEMLADDRLTYTSLDDFLRDVEAHQGLTNGSLTSSDIIDADPGWPTAPQAPTVDDPTPDMYPVLTNCWDDIVAQRVAEEGLDPAIYTATRPVTFMVEREREINTDINPYITRTGSWFVPPVPASIDWPSWSLISPLPTTGAFQPDQWVGSSPPPVTVPGPSPQQDGIYDGVVPKSSSDRDERIDAPWKDDIPVSVGTDDAVWLRIERITGTDLFRLLYAVLPKAQAASAADFIAITGADGTELQVDSRIFGQRSFVGPCLQSGDKHAFSTLTFSDLSMSFNTTQASESVAAKAEPHDLLDKDDWEVADEMGATYTSKYLCSQYQVFWGPYDITEDFFTYHDSRGDLIADEVWIYNTREFGSQSRWWPSGAEKEERSYYGADGHVEDEHLYPTSAETRTYRELLAKQTMFDVNVGAFCDYLKQRDLATATRDVVVGGYDVSNAVSVGGTGLMKDHYNGLFYAARQNRYPWNPNLDLDNQDGHNPWTWPLRVPNRTQPISGIAGLGTNDDIGEFLMAIEDPLQRRDLYDRIVRGTASDRYDPATPDDNRLVDRNSHPKNMLNGEEATGEVRYVNLQPYLLGNAPAFRPQEYIHGVRFRNAEHIDWGQANGTSGAAIDTLDALDFGTSKTIFVTPNQLCLQGDFNTATYPAIVEDAVPPVIEDKFTPVAVVGDSVTLLSNGWNDKDWQRPGLIVDADSVDGGGSLYQPWSLLPEAETTTYNTSIITHNQPTTKESVRDGEAASIATVLLFLEDWYRLGNQQSMHFKGSLVVMDSRRYSEAYLLDVEKRYGRTPFGTMGWHQRQGFHEDALIADYNTDTAGYLVWGSSPNIVSGPTMLGQVYRAPHRDFDFNDDLLTAAGTPPFTPFGVTSSGTGNWIKVLK